jgi:multisubunit Na+/H+ antiporter MnhB subunit
MIRATISKDLTTISGDRELFGVVVSIIMLAVIFIFGIKVFSDIPQFGTNIISLFEGAPSNVYLSQGLKETGAPNIVSSIILDYRAYDTLGEATILFTAILGALAILRQKTKRKTKGK